MGGPGRGPLLPWDQGGLDWEGRASLRTSVLVCIGGRDVQVGGEERR